MKSDAEVYRKSEKLPPAALYTLRVDTREELSALLNALCGITTALPLGGPEIAPPEVIERNTIEVIPPDFVPAFLLKDKH